MLQRFKPTVVYCLEKADECAALAKTATDSDSQLRFIKIEASWRHLAEQYQVIERTKDFLGQSH